MIYSFCFLIIFLCSLRCRISVCHLSIVWNHFGSIWNCSFVKKLTTQNLELHLGSEIVLRTVSEIVLRIVLGIVSGIVLESAGVLRALACKTLRRFYESAVDPKLLSAFNAFTIVSFAIVSFAIVSIRRFVVDSVFFSDHFNGYISVPQKSSEYSQIANNLSAQASSRTRSSQKLQSYVPNRNFLSS